MVDRNGEAGGGRQAQESQEAQENRSEHLQALGEMLVGVAHELNTPLGALISLLESMHRCQGMLGEILDRPRLDADAQADLRAVVGRMEQSWPVITTACDRIQGLVRELRLAGRPDAQEPPGPVPLVPIIEGDLLLLQYALKHGVTVERRFAAEPVVLGHTTLLGQVFLNLLRNAIQALEGKGTITLGIRERGGAAEVTVADDGPGIAPDVLPRLFQEHCTTKARADGTGLGLLVTERIVRKYGGTIGAANAPTGGAVFTVTLPLA